MRRSAFAIVAVLLAAGCGGGNATPAPIVEQIDGAIAAVEGYYGAPQQYFEISATLTEVSVIVAVDGATAAEQGRFTVDGGLSVPEPVGSASGSTFTADAVTFDADSIFDGLRSELDDPTIRDFAIQGTPSGSVLYDAVVVSDSGGVLLVRLGPTGQILGVQAT